MPAVPLQSLWSVTAPAGPACEALAGAWGAQAAVIGAGYTGLSAALHLAQAGREVLVLEAADIGAGASGSNGGQVIPGVKHDPDTLEQMFGPEAGARPGARAGAADDTAELRSHPNPVRRPLPDANYYTKTTQHNKSTDRI